MSDKITELHPVELSIPYGAQVDVQGCNGSMLADGFGVEYDANSKWLLKGPGVPDMLCVPGLCNEAPEIISKKTIDDVDLKYENSLYLANTTDNYKISDQKICTSKKICN